MDNSFSFASTATRLQQSGTGTCSPIPAESPLRVAPLIKEVVRAAAIHLMSETGLLRKKVESTAPCFAIRTRNFADLSLMTDALPREIWDLVSGMLATEDIQVLFSTCTIMKACLEKQIDKAEQQYAQSAKKILNITKDDALTNKQVTQKLTQYLDRQTFVKIPLSKAKREPNILAAIGQNKLIKLLHIDARNLDSKISGRIVGLSLCNLGNTLIELDISDNNSPYFDLLSWFYTVSESNWVSSLKLDRTTLGNVDLSTTFFKMLFSPTCRIRNLSLAGTGRYGCLSDFSMSMLAYGLMFNQPARLETLDISSTPAEPGLARYPKGAGLSLCPRDNSNLDPMSFEAFSRKALKNDKKSGLHLIIKALKKNTTLTALNLSNCHLGEKMTKTVADSLQKNMTLRKLHLGNNAINDEGIKALAKAVARHPSLEFLSLASNDSVTRKGWIDFFSVLTGNTGLRHLNLDFCAIGDNGAAALAAMLKENSTAKELILSNNQITVKGMAALAKSLDGHSSIRLLDLGGNQLPLEHVSILEHLVTGGIRVRVSTGIQYRATKANGRSSGTPHDLNKNADVIENEDVWLETSA
nr:hypothetical protein [uncultured Noviherbaspirillum sp.]